MSGSRTDVLCGHYNPPTYAGECEIESPASSALDAAGRPEPDIGLNTSATRDFALPLASATLAAVITFLMLRPGVNVEPDGWAYWEGSVSLLNGLGFRYFGGQPIVDFPPLFPTVLMLIQSVFGVSGATLAGTLVGLAGFTAFLWCRLLVRLTSLHPLPIVPRLAGALYIPAFIGVYYTNLLSETLFLALIAAVLLCLTRIPQDLSGRGAWKWLAASALAATALLMTRNSGVAFMPGFALVVFLRLERCGLLKRIVIAAVTTGLPCAIWSLTRGMMKQLHSHPPSGLARYTALDYLRQAFGDLAYRLGPNWGYLGALLLLAALVTLSLFFIRRANPASPTHQAARHVLVVAAAAACTLFALFNLTWIADPFSGRFIWYMPLTLAVSLASGATVAPRSLGKCLCLGLLIALLLIQIGRTGWHIRNRLTTPPVTNVHGNDTISPEYYDQPPVQRGTRTLISPSNFPWIKRPAPSSSITPRETTTVDRPGG